MKKILVTSGSWQSALACTQSLGRRKHEVYLVDELLSAPLYSRYCRGRIPSPAEKNEDQYVEFVLNLVKTKTYDVLIPISETVVRYCAKHKRELERFIHLVLPDHETLSLAADKGKLYAFAAKQNIFIPKTYLPSDLLEVGKLAEKDIFPCVIKIPISIAGKGVFYIHNQEELRQAYRSQKFDGQWPVIQEFVDGDFYGLTCVALEGKIVMFFMYKTPRKYSMEGTPPILFSVVDEVLLGQARDIILKLGWNGAINLDFLKDPERGYVLLEVNPRFGGTLNFAYRMGIDLPWAYCQLALGAEPKEIKQLDYPQGVMFRTIFPTEILRCYTHKNYWKVFLKNFFSLKCKSNIYWDDPGLLWGQIKETRWYWQDMKLPNKAA
jgi:predicted ATP-grasp superfamily ATP-dependent carboligase